MNKCIVSGRLSRDVELKKTESGKSVCSFSLGVENRNGGADFLDFVAWEKTAEVISQYVRQGDKILVIGHITKRKYDNKDGQTVYVTEIVVESMEFMTKKKTDDQKQTAGVVDAEYSEKDDGPKFDTGPQLDISSDDLPF